MCGLCDSRIKRRAQLRRTQTHVTLVAPFNGIHDFEDRKMDDGHRPARSARAELFAVDASLSRRNRRVIEPAGIDRDLIPMANAGRSIEPVAGTRSYIRLCHAGVRMKPRAERILKPTAQTFRRRPLRKCQQKQEHNDRHHLHDLHTTPLPLTPHRNRRVAATHSGAAARLRHVTMNEGSSTHVACRFR